MWPLALTVTDAGRLDTGCEKLPMTALLTVSVMVPVMVIDCGDGCGVEGGTGTVAGAG